MTPEDIRKARDIIAYSGSSVQFCDAARAGWSMALEEIERLQKLTHDMDSRYDEFISENRKLRAVVNAVIAMRKEAMTYENWYTFVTCEFGEDVDDALKTLENK